MLNRIGNVIGWTGNAIGFLLIGIGAFGLLQPKSDKSMVILLAVVPGVLIFLIGIALRYILVNPN
jgi:hypothetical protein